MFPVRSFATIAILTGACGSALSQDLATQATSILRSHCYQCHGAKRQGDPDYDISNLDYLRGDSKLIVAGDKPQSKSQTKSRIMKRIEAGQMPPGGLPKLTAAEASTVRKWIASGAPNPGQEKLVYAQPKIEFADKNYVKAAIGADQLRLGVLAVDARYLSIANLYNIGYAKDALDIARAAMSKATNSLSLGRFVSKPVAVDGLSLVYRISLSQIGWTAQQWNEVLNAYPYSESPNFVRSDWFVATTLHPPLYYDLLGLPGTEGELEREVGVDRDADVLTNRAQRAAITDSAVAIHNRVLELHPSVFGVYRLSYDVKNEDADRRIIRNPLGPQFNGNPFANRAFKHDGAEIIFDLPNGLHGYYAANGNGKRVDAVPNEIANDPTQLSGSPSIVPGISCMGCHSQGIQTKISDVARDGSPVNGIELAKLDALYPPKEQFSKCLEGEKAKYLSVVKLATGTEQEPIRPSVEAYNRPLDLLQVAIESNQRDSSALSQLINTRGDLQAFGLRPLIEGKTITRATWESAEFGITPAQRVAQLLGD